MARCFPKVAGRSRGKSRVQLSALPPTCREESWKASRSMPKLIAQSRPLALGRGHVILFIGLAPTPKGPTDGHTVHKMMVIVVERHSGEK